MLPTDAMAAVYAALDDEYLASSLYKNILTVYGDVRPFSNIIHAENRHADKLIELLQKYEEPVPSNPYENGTKPAPVVPVTLLEACQTGIDAEIENIALYDEKLLPAVQDFPDITYVFTQLRDASEQRHLPAFQRCVSRGGVMGQGQGQGGGRGKGRGRQ